MQPGHVGQEDGHNAFQESLHQAGRVKTEQNDLRYFNDFCIPKYVDKMNKIIIIRHHEADIRLTDGHLVI